MPMAECKDGDIHFERNGMGDPMVMLLPQSSGPVGVEPVSYTHLTLPTTPYV